MPLDSPGAVLRLEVRPAQGARHAGPDQVETRLREARNLLEGRVPPPIWTPEAGGGVTGRIRLASAVEAFPLLHGLRTELRKDPGPVPLDIAAGLGAGGELDGHSRAVDAFQALKRKRRQWTQAITGNPDSDVVLAALCRTIDTLIGGWTDAQWQAVYRRDHGKTLQQIGEDLGIAYQNVSKRLIAARYALYQDVLGAASLVFSRRSV